MISIVSGTVSIGGTVIMVFGELSGTVIMVVVGTVEVLPGTVVNLL